MSSAIEDRTQGITEGPGGHHRTRKVLFVCTANVCRSPMAAAMFGALAEEAGLACEPCSAGTDALINEPIDPGARAALEEVGVYAESHRARQVDAAVLEEADLVLAMTPEHAAALHRLSATARPKVRTLLEYASGVPDSEGIPDPYGQPVTAYRASVRRLLHSISVLVERIGRER